MAEETESKSVSAVSEERPYLIIFTPVLLRVLALVTLGMAVSLFAAALLTPQYFDADNARFILCLAVATTLSIFFFVFYPQSVEFKLPTMIGSALRVFGPIALWFGIFLFLWQQMPSPEKARLLRPVRNDKPVKIFYNSDAEFRKPDGKLLNYWLVKDRNDRYMYGVYVEFEEGARSYEAVFEHPPYEPVTVKLSRDGDDTFEVPEFKVKENR